MSLLLAAGGGGLAPVAGSADTAQGGQGATATAALAFAGVIATVQGTQVASGSAVQAISGLGATGQGVQSGVALASLAFFGNAVTLQGRAGASGAASQILEGLGAAAQGSQSIQVTGELIYAGGVATGQGSQSSGGSDTDATIGGLGDSSQGGQETSGTADAEAAVVYMGAGRTRGRWHSPQPVLGHGESSQTGAQTVGLGGQAIEGDSQSGQGPGEANGFARVLMPIVGAGACMQGPASFAGHADVDNRIPRNRQKARIAAALLLTA